ncbi:hypothetical protein PRK78_004016 [Emydomyces testavorans]|uniref:SNF2 N-terminal domain-containing protein n=1 Tax=Emydomyces testavorans TaxID=2070801 RepID=A0AAF0DHV3_9EURO|nr:hypothetical protein PRK78_004016 [Emydomyces testavorans]
MGKQKPSKTTMNDSDNEFDSHEVLPKLHSKKNFMQALNINTDSEFISFLRGETYLPVYRELYLCYILPRHQETSAQGKATPRGPALSDVQRAISFNESCGRRKYSKPVPDKQKWTAVDHYARYMVQAKLENCAHEKGAFYLRRFSDLKMEHILHSLAKWLTHAHAPSRLNQRSGGISLLGNLSAEAGLGMGAPLNLSNARGNGHTEASFNIPADTFGVPDDGVREATHSIAPKRPSGGSPEEKARKKARLEDADPNPQSDTEADSDRRDEGLTPHDLYKLSKISDTPNFSELFWNVQFFKKALKSATPVPDKNNSSNLEHEEEISDETSGNEPVKETLIHNNFITDAIAWHSEIAGDGSNSIIVPTDKDIETFQMFQKWLDNQIYQRDNHLAACMELGIRNTNIPRMWGMRMSRIFKFWQPVAIKAINDFEKNPALRGGLLADSVELGRIIETIGYMLYQAKTFLNGPRPLPAAKPFLIVAPPALVYQWYDEITVITNQLRPYLYYGDLRDKRTGHRHVDSRLTKHAKYFDGKDKRALAVILTSYATLNARHGPVELRNYHAKKRCLMRHSKAVTTKPDLDWEFHLGGLFDRVILDEAHIV